MDDGDCQIGIGKLRGVPIGDCLWQDIDTPEMYRVAQELAVKLDEVL